MLFLINLQQTTGKDPYYFPKASEQYIRDMTLRKKQPWTSECFDYIQLQNSLRVSDGVNLSIQSLTWFAETL